jgi:hypothetical protein
MSYRKAIGITALIVVGSAVGGYYWLRARSEASLRAATARLSESMDSPANEPPVAATNTSGTPPTGGENKNGEPAPDPGLPLRGGEVLEYTANVANLNNVADLKLRIAEHKDFLGKNAWHLQAFAHTENPLRMVFELDDQFDSYSDAATMTSLQYEMHLSERGQKVDSVQRMTAGREPAPPNATAARVLPGTRDPLGMMQFLRNVDWTKTAEVRGPVYDGHKLYDVRAKLAGAGEAVTVPAGSYKASKIEIRVFENGQEMKDAHFTIYFANNVARTPVLLEAVMPFATAQVQLMRAK